jgi:hypothetical protein
MAKRLWLSGLAIVTACSWGRFLLTGSPKVDENYPSERAAIVLFVALVVGWSLLVAGWRALLAHPPDNPRRLAFAGLLVAALMLPMLSNDVYSALSYGWLAAHGRDVYTTTAWLQESAWRPWVGDLWSQTVCVYGPTTLAAVMPAAALAGDNPWVALGLLRLFWFVPLAVVMELTFRRLRDRPLFHVMVWLNPLWIVDGPGQLHTDMLGVIAVTAGVLLQRSGRARGGWVAWSAAAIGKYSFASTFPWFWLSGARTLRQRVLRVPAIAAVLVALGLVCFAPFWNGPATLTEPIAAVGRMNPGSTVPEVAGYVVYTLRTGRVSPPDVPGRDLAQFDRETKGTTWRIATLLMRVLALGVGLRLLAAMLRGPHDEDRIALGTGALVVAAVTLASHRFHSWYLVAALPFFGLYCNEAWRRWWVMIVSVSVAVLFVHVLPPQSWLLPVWSAITTACLMAVFFMSFRARYLRLESGSADARPGATAPAAP